MRQGFPRSGLFLELTKAIFVAVFLTFVVNAGLAVIVGRAYLIRLVEESLSLRTRRALGAVEHHLAHCSQEVTLWSHLDTLDDLLIQDRSLRIENFLLGLLRDHAGHYDLIEVVDRDDVVVASTDVSRIGLKTETLGTTNLPRAKIVPQKEGNNSLVLTAPIVSRLDIEPIGRIVAHVSWEPVRQILADAEFDGKPQGLDRFYVLFDPSDEPLPGTPAVLTEFSDELPKLRFGDVQSVSVHRLNGTSYLVALEEAHRDDGPRVVLAGAWKRAEANSVVGLFMVVMFGSAILGLAIAAGVSFFLARRISLRIGELTRGTQRLADGDFEYQVEEGEDDEIGQLARSFNNLAAYLRDSRRELASSLARWRGLVEHAPDFILTLDRDGTIQFINRVQPHLTVEQVTGSSIYSFIPPKFHDAQRRALEEVFRTKQPGAFEMEAEGPFGEPTWYSTRLGPIQQGDDVVGVAMVARDITQRKRLERDILEVSESERQRIGLDLHDDLGQLLTGISLLVKNLQNRCTATGSDEARDFEKVMNLIGDAIDDTRGLARGLFPSRLQQAGLSAALEDLASSVDGAFDGTCEFRNNVPRIAIHQEKALHVYRIVQEALNNSIRHAGARAITVTLTAEREHTRLTVEDDGRWVRPATEVEEGMGMRLMKYRASLIGASLHVGPREGGGTEVSCLF